MTVCRNELFKQHFRFQFVQRTPSGVRSVGQCPPVLDTYNIREPFNASKVIGPSADAALKSRSDYLQRVILIT